MKLLSLRRAALLPALFALVACSDGPVAPEGEWAVGTWSFMTAACWPDFTVTPETLGHPVTLHLGANGRAWVDEGDGSVAHADFTVTERARPAGTSAAPRTLHVLAVEARRPQVPGGVARRLVVEVRRGRVAVVEPAGGDGRARTRSPNSTTATKLLPLVPYHRLVPLARRRAERGERAPARRGEAHGMRGLRRRRTFRSMSPLIRWNRLISPHGVRQSPKSSFQPSDAADERLQPLRRRQARVAAYS
jgi:hypothetical protein